MTRPLAGAPTSRWATAIRQARRPLIASAALFVAVLWSPIPAPAGVILNGGLVGLRIALIAMGIALIFRSNRVVNFAQGDLGAVPATVTVLLVVGGLKLPYVVGFAAGLAAAVLLGIAVETLVVRRFFRSPRLVLTVATIALTQLLIALALLLPQWIGGETLTGRLVPPFTVRLELGGTIFNANDVLTLVVAPAALLALALVLRRSRIGVAVRASAENADRASMLGIQVRRLETYVWVLATVFAFLAMFLRAGAVGLPIGSVLGPNFLLQALAAAVLGGMSRLPTIVAAAIGLGIVDQALTFQPGNTPARNDLVLVAIILAGVLLVRRPDSGRVDPEAESTWQASEEMRPVPPELAQVAEVRWARWILGILIPAAALSLPLWMSSGSLNLATIIVIFAIIGVSLTLLTGWAGHVSLGQVAFVGLGAAVGGSVTSRLDLDLAAAVVAAGLAGAAVAVLVGYPALRRRGLTLAITTLGLALLVPSWLLNRQLFEDWLPASRIDRPDLLGVISTRSETAYYLVSLGALVLSIAAAQGIRRSRTGRVLVAARDNDRAARSFGVHTTRSGLSAFALSGFLASGAGALYVHQQSGLSAGAYAPEQSLAVFSMVVIGGLGSIPGAVLGAIYVLGAQHFLPAEWRLLSSGGGLLLVLLVLPGGLESGLYQTRDILLRRLAARRGILVPSLLADRREADDAPNPLATAAHGTEPGTGGEDTTGPVVVDEPGADTEDGVADDAAPVGR